jgi:LITAF-like zinc ribbon domain
MPKQIICPNTHCGYKGLAREEKRGSTLLGVILCFFFLVPGILYFIFRSGYRYYCPQCGMQIAQDN